MKKLSLILLASLGLSSCGQDDQKKYADGHSDADHARIEAEGKTTGHDDGHAHDAPTVKAEIIAQGPFNIGQSQKVTMRLTDIKTGKPLGPDDVAIAHTKKVHLLIIDQSLSDYHHIHPTPGAKAGEWVFDFKPQFAADYRIWADIVPIGGSQQYVSAAINAGSKPAPALSSNIVQQVKVDGLSFSLSFNGPLKAGQDVMGNVAIIDAVSDAPFTQLEPIMGAFGHIVAFAGDWDSIEHVHPRGKEPTSKDERRGPVLSFHMKPEKSGIMKIFVQTQVNGKDVFAPFTVKVN